MQRHFSFGHTIVPQESDEDSSNLLDLFKIGQQQISIPKKQQPPSSGEEDSDRTVRQKKEKKEKKVKKEKREKDHKHKQKKDKHKQKKEKHKQKKEKEKRQQGHKRDRSSQSLQQINQQLVPYDKARKAELLQKYAKVLDGKTIDERLAQKFDLKVKLAEGTLNVDIIRFPETRLYQYGPMDKQIPRYQRLPDFEMIVGFKKSKQRRARKIIRQLNRIINQQNINPLQDEISVDRYFHFEGYEHTGLERLACQPKGLAGETLLRFDLKEGTTGSEEEVVLRLTREFNKRLNENPKNIDLWVEFVGLQDKFSLSVGTLRNKGAVADRKVSILEKALHLNPNNERLGLLYLVCLFERQADHKVISGKCLELIRENPWSVGLWKFYFSLSIERFSSYSHTHLRKTFEEMSEVLKRAIQRTKSAVEIWRIRKAALEVTKSMLQVYKLEGYGELATGIIVALLEYNIFMPEEATRLPRLEDKLHLFQKYWEDCQAYKLGETNRGNSWSNVVTSCGKEDEFIGDYLCPERPKQRTPAVMKEIRESEKAWRMSNANKDQKIIENQPESFILYEDIDFAMMLYRDGDSITSLIDALADHLELPLVFSATPAYSQFGFQLVDRALKQAINGKDRLQWLSFHRCGYFWAQFWDPTHTDRLLPDHAFAKLEYLRRVLISAKGQLPAHRTAINQYLSFLACVTYLSPRAQAILRLSPQQSLERVGEVLQQEPLNLPTWSMYIEATFASKNNQEECLECFLQLFETAKATARPQELVELHFQILFWLAEFCRNHQIFKGRAVLKIMKKIIFGETEDPFSLDEQVNVFDCLQMEQYFRAEIQKLVGNMLSKSSKQSVMTRYRGAVFMLYYLQEFPTSALNELAEKVTLLLIGELDTAGSSKENLFIIKLLTSFRLLTHEQIAKYELLRLFPYPTLIEYWVASSRKPFLLLVSEFEALEQRQLALWMTICIFLWRGRGSQGHMYEYFCSVAKKICFEDRLCDQRAEFIALLNELLAYDVNEDHTKFITYSLHHVPFSKKLYMLNLLLAPDQNDRRKLSAIIQEKCIRVLDQAILQ